jgi:hypothetical protein
MVEMRNSYNILVGKPEGKRLLEKPRRRWKYMLILKWILKRMSVRKWTGCNWLRTGSRRGSCNTVMSLRVRHL